MRISHAILAAIIVAAMGFIVLSWPFGRMAPPDMYVALQVGKLKSSLREASERMGVGQDDIISQFPVDTNGITSALRKFLCIENGPDLQKTFLKDREGNDILVFRKADLPETQFRTWMHGHSNVVYVWGVGSNKRNEWGEGDDVVIDFDGLSVLR